MQDVLASTMQEEITLIADPRVLAIPILEDGEAMVDLRTQDTILYGPSPEIPDNTDYTFMRRTVYEKLCAAQKQLPEGIRFKIYEAYRSLSLQQILFDNRYNEISAHCPDWDEKQRFNETIKMVSPVVNLDGSRNIPPHSTGGAIDVYLVDADGKDLDMGIHPKDWTQDLAGTLSLTASTCISAEAQKNRRLMAEVLQAVGFVNYPTEYWHWSYGDRYWAYHAKEKWALYGSYVPKVK
ncbi:MAG: M15 family metallopeptidase [Holosporales bacterium]